MRRPTMRKRVDSNALEPLKGPIPSRRQLDDEETDCLSPRSICRLSSRPALGRSSSSWAKDESLRDLNEVYLQFDYDNMGYLNRSKVLALFLRYSPGTSEEQVMGTFEKFAQKGRLDYVSFVHLIGHEQKRGRFDLFNINSVDLMFDTEQQRRTRELQRLVDRIEPRNNAVEDEKPILSQDRLFPVESNRNLFRGLRSSIRYDKSVGQSLLEAVKEHAAANKLKIAANNEEETSTLGGNDSDDDEVSNNNDRRRSLHHSKRVLPVLKPATSTPHTRKGGANVSHRQQHLVTMRRNENPSLDGESRRERGDDMEHNARFPSTSSSAVMSSTKKSQKKRRRRRRKRGGDLYSNNH